LLATGSVFSVDVAPPGAGADAAREGTAGFLDFPFGLVGDDFWSGLSCARATGTRQNANASIANRFAVAFASLIFLPYRFAGAAVGVGVACPSVPLVKNVVIVKTPVTDAPAAMRNFVFVLPLNPESFKSPTLMIRERRPIREKKSSTE
jgi:hypothetical protein